MDKYNVRVSGALVEALAGIAAGMDIDSVETLVDAMLREKVYGLTGQKVPSLVSLMQSNQDQNEEDLAANLRKAVADTGRSTFNETSLGPDVDQAPEQYMNMLGEPVPPQQPVAQPQHGIAAPVPQPQMQPQQLAPMQQPMHQPAPRQADLEKIAEQEQRINYLNSLVQNMQAGGQPPPQQQPLHPQQQQGQPPFGTRQG